MCKLNVCVCMFGDCYLPFSCFFLLLCPLLLYSQVQKIKKYVNERCVCMHHCEQNRQAISFVCVRKMHKPLGGGGIALTGQTFNHSVWVFNVKQQIEVDVDEKRQKNKYTRKNTLPSLIKSYIRSAACLSSSKMHTSRCCGIYLLTSS